MRLYAFQKSERLVSQLVIDKLFAGGNASMAVFPLRVVYMKLPRENEAQPPVSVLVSVPKRRFRHAADRNRLKRLVREAYRQNKRILWQALEGKDFWLAVGFVCITDVLPTFRVVKKSVVKALVRIAEKQGA